MEVERLNKFSQQISEILGSGNYDEALRLTRQLQSQGNHYLISYIVGGLLIDIGNALRKEEIVLDGVNLLERDLKVISSNKRYAASVHYNLANGYSTLFNFQKLNNPFAVCFRDTELDKARRHYEKAIQIGSKDALLLSSIWVNLGNCYDDLGRVIDALECYEEALKWQQDYGMALGNKGVGLYSYARVAGEHQGTFLIEAYQLIKKALELGVSIEAVPRFEGYAKLIWDNFVGDKQLLENPPQYPGYEIRAQSKMERFLIEFCLRNKLYLNPCNYCQRCDSAIGDTALIKKMVVPIGTHSEQIGIEDDQYLRLSAYLNQIKQDYVTARFLLVLSRYRGLNLDFVDKRVRIINTMDYSLHSIYAELVKSSFKGFYDILDKIAFFINDYLKLNILDKKISFHNVWYKDPQNKSKGIRERILNTNNHSLNALFDLHKDFSVREDKDLAEIRNSLTHRFTKVHMFQADKNNATLTEDKLVERTLELARVTRTAILYLLHFVYLEENKKEKEHSGYIPTIIATELPDNLKND